MEEGKLEQLNLSQEEIVKFGKAFENEKFRQLFREYVEEISDPVNRRKLEQEIVQLERENGREAVLIEPAPGYLIKTSENGHSKAYVNICSCEKITEIVTSPATREEINGVQLTIPYSVSPVQRDQLSRHIYTVVLNPSTLKYALENEAVKKLVNETVLSAVERMFNVSLDKVNVRYSKKAHKGTLEKTIIRDKNSIPKACANGTLGDYTEPTYVLKYRNEVDLQNCTNHKYSKLDILKPERMLVEIKLPLLESVANAKLDITATSIQLRNDEPVKYKLSIPLSYPVDESQSTAKFDADSHTLKLELSVRKGVTDTPAAEPSPQLVTELCDSLVQLSTAEKTVNGDGSAVEPFLNPDIKYKLPTYFCNYHQNKMVLTLKAKNVCPDSFTYQVVEPRKGCFIKFCTLGSGYFPMYYSFCVIFDKELLTATEPVSYSLDGDNVFVYLSLMDGEVPLQYFVGPNAENTVTEYLNELESILVEVNDKKPEKLDMNFQVTEFNPEEVTVDLRLNSKKVATKKSTTPPEAVATNGDSSTANRTDLDKSQRKFMETIDHLKRTSATNGDDKGSVSEPEQRNNTRHVRINSSNRSASDVENRSWITTESKSSKKACRKRRALEKKMSKEGFANAAVKLGGSLEEDSVFPESPKLIDTDSAYKYADLVGICVELTSRSILKKNRSFSESSGDELFHVHSSRSYSVDDIAFSSDSCGTSVPKKTVTFNDIISKKLYSSEISILEQRKRSKRRTQRKERRASESDTSETECSNSNSAAAKSALQENLRVYNESLFSENSETELTSVSESGETSDDQSDTQEHQESGSKMQDVPCSKKNHKRRGKKSARKNASTAKHNFQGADY